MEHLLGVMGSEEAELVAVHEFLWDRFREVRGGDAGGVITLMGSKLS